MPIQITHAESGIFCTHWNGSVTYDDMLDTQEACRTSAIEAGITHYVLIFDMTQLPKLPFTPRQTGKLISPDDKVLRTIIVGASKQIKLISATVNMIFKQMHPIQHYDTMDEAMAYAHRVLEDMQKGAV